MGVTSLQNNKSLGKNWKHDKTGKLKMENLKKLKWKNEPFSIPDDILKAWREIGEKGIALEKQWLESLNKKNSNIKKELEEISNNKNLKNLDKLINSEKEKYFKEKPTKATRECSSGVIETISPMLSELVGGSADLSGSNNTKTKNVQ